MKLLKELILKKNIKKIGKGLLTVVDNAALGGAITKTIQETKESKSGEIPYLEVISAMVPVILLREYSKVVFRRFPFPSTELGRIIPKKGDSIIIF